MGHGSQIEPRLTPNDPVPLCRFQNRWASSRRSNENRWSRNPKPLGPVPSDRDLAAAVFFLASSQSRRCHAPGALTIRFTNYGMHCSGQISRDRNCYDVDEDGAKDESSRLEWDCCLLLAIT